METKISSMTKQVTKEVNKVIMKTIKHMKKLNNHFIISLCITKIQMIRSQGCSTVLHMHTLVLISDQRHLDSYKL